jgi:hypothetical protein
METQTKIPNEITEFQERFLCETFDIIKGGIDKGQVKDTLYEVKEDDISVYVVVKETEFELVLDEILQYFIKLERYEDCQDIVDYKQKLKRLQDGTITPTTKNKL